MGPSPVCDLDVIQIFSSGCWLHKLYTTVCFCGVKYTTQHMAINKHDRFDTEMKMDSLVV